MTLDEVMKELEKAGDENTRKTHIRHGAKEPLFGVKVQELKKIMKKTKHDYKLSLQLYDIGNSDAMYLAGLISKPMEMTIEEINHWADKAYWNMLSEYIVPWVASESRFGAELAREWIKSDRESIASAGWSTWSSLTSIKPDSELDLEELYNLLQTIPDKLRTAKDRVTYTMNGFVICVGSYVIPLFDTAMEVAEKIGKVQVDMKGTACKVPSAVDYLNKIKNMNRIGHKKKTAFC